MELEFLSLDDDSTETAEIRQLLLCPNNKIVLPWDDELKNDAVSETKLRGAVIPGPSDTSSAAKGVVSVNLTSPESDLLHRNERKEGSIERSSREGTPTGLNPNAKSFVPRGASEYQQSAPSVRPAEPVSYQAQPLTTFQPSVPAHPQVNGQQREISYMDHRQASMLWYNYSQQPVSLQQRPVYGTPIQNHTPHSLQGPALYLTSPTFRPPQVVAPPPIQTKPNPQVQPVTSLVEPPSLTTHPPSSPSDSSSPTVDSDMGLEVVGFSMPDNTAVLTKSPAVVMPRPPHRNTTILPTNDDKRKVCQNLDQAFNAPSENDCKSSAKPKASNQSAVPPVADKSLVETDPKISSQVHTTRTPMTAEPLSASDLELFTASKNDKDSSTVTVTTAPVTSTVTSVTGVTASQGSSVTISTLSADNTSAPRPAVKWSSLFAGSGQPAVKPVEPKPTIISPTTTVEKPVNEKGAILAELKISQKSAPIQVRRLLNRANWCYINATLQALIACPPFYHMLKSLPMNPMLGENRSVTRVLDAMVEFANQFSEMQPVRSKQKKRVELKSGDPFEPNSVYNALSVMRSSDKTFHLGKQEDAEEFLSCLLNTLHEEIGAAIKQNQAPVESQPNGNGVAESGETGAVDGATDDNWEQVGPKNKSIVTHSNVHTMTTPISQIFGGQLRSLLCTNKESATLEPFFTVPLNVQHAGTIEEALKEFVSKEAIEGYTCPQTKAELDAHRRLMFEELPSILILHLKCFIYDVKTGGSQKIMHTINFREDLEFERELISPQAKGKYRQRQYKLFAVVYHSGMKTTGGHYWTNVFHPGVHSWVHFDDNCITPIPAAEVFTFKSPAVPYLLYYKKCAPQAT